ncbi:MAG: hypothetical protein LC791_07910 [Acidobacteria bacterium]|nr:hypothetical protein [Acidobacteriota bacterium]
MAVGEAARQQASTRIVRSHASNAPFNVLVERLDVGFIPQQQQTAL